MTIRPRFLRPGIMIPLGAIACFFVAAVVFDPSVPAVMGFVLFVLAHLLAWSLTRRIRLEITETEVRARQGGWSDQNDKRAPRSEIRAIRYYPKRISFRGPDDQPLMEPPVDSWTVREMLKAAEVLQVPLYDHGGRYGLEEVSEGRLAYDPATGPAARRKLSAPAAPGREGIPQP
jgi:hypothetical protein